MFTKGKKWKLCFSIRGKIWQETWYGEENKCFTLRRVFKHHQPGWLGESAEDRIWHSRGETLIGDCIAQPASVVSQVCEFGPPLAKGAEMDHVETGTQSNCIWKANFPGCWRLKMSNCLRKQTPWPHRCMQWSFQDVPNITVCSSWHNLPLPNPQILPQYPKKEEQMRRKLRDLSKAVKKPTPLTGFFSLLFHLCSNNWIFSVKLNPFTISQSSAFGKWYLPILWKKNIWNSLYVLRD